MSQSKYFRPQFNHALFHGSLRFYFPKYIEGMMLRIYGLIQKRASLEGIALDLGLRFCPPINILVIFYPHEVFSEIFQCPSPYEKIRTEFFQNDIVLGVRGVLEPGYEENLLLDEIIKAFRWINIKNQDVLSNVLRDPIWGKDVVVS